MKRDQQFWRRMYCKIAGCHDWSCKDRRRCMGGAEHYCLVCGVRGDQPHGFLDGVFGHTSS